MIPLLLAAGARIRILARHPDDLRQREWFDDVEVVQGDAMAADDMDRAMKDVDVAYYLMHSMASSTDFQKAELRSAVNFREAISSTAAKQVIYLTGIINEDELSEHLASRKAVEEEEEEVVEEDDIPFDEEAAEAEEEVEEEAEEEVEDEEVDDDSEVEEAMQKANSRASRRSAPSLDDYEEDAETEDDSAMAKKAAKKAAPKASPKKAAGAKKPVKK